MINMNDNLKPLADEYGQIKAEEAELKARKKAVMDQLKGAGVHELEGDLFRVVLSDVPDSIGTDWEAIARKLKPSRQLMRAHRKVTKKGHTRISVYARTGQESAA